MKAITRRTAGRIAVVMAAGVMAACGGSGSPQGSAPGESINGVLVPPAPDAVTNAATLAGVDTDANGIRDDIDRRIASEFGADLSAAALARDHARRLHAAVITPGNSAREAYVGTIRCLQDETLLQRLSDQTLATLDTPERRSAFARAMRGLVLSSEGC
jgi:hypothetical protein